MFKFFLLVTLITIAFSQLVVVPGPSSMTVSYQNLTIDVRLTGVPRFTISSGQNTNRLIFSKIYQTQFDSTFKQKLGGTNVALASMNWVVSQPILTNNNTQVEFNFTGTTNSRPWTLVFRNRVTTQKPQLKFDTFFYNFGQEWNKDAGFLVLAYNLQTGDSNPTQQQQNGNKINFDNAFFSVQPTANSGAIVETILSNDEDNQNAPTAFVLYQKFGDSLEHDPTLGVEAYPPQGNYVFVIVAIVVVIVVAAFFALGVVIGGLFYYFRKEAGFQSL